MYRCYGGEAAMTCPFRPTTNVSILLIGICTAASPPIIHRHNANATPNHFINCELYAVPNCSEVQRFKGSEVQLFSCPATSIMGIGIITSSVKIINQIVSEE